MLLSGMLRPMLGIAAALTVLSASAAFAADETRVVFVTHGQSGDPYWSVVKNGMDDAAKTLGVKAEYLAPETFDMAKMAQMIDAAAASKPDGLVVSIPDAAALSRAGQERGRRRASRSSSSTRAAPSSPMNSAACSSWARTSIQAGVMAGERTKAAGVTKAVCVNHEVGNSASTIAAPASPRASASTCRCMQRRHGSDRDEEPHDRLLTAHPDVEFMLGGRRQRRRADAGGARRTGPFRQGQDSAPSTCRRPSCRRPSTARWNGASTPSNMRWATSRS